MQALIKKEHYRSHELHHGTIHSTIQSTRKKLKRMRKWQSDHKAEVTLVKCISKYFKQEIPMLTRRGDFYDNHGKSKE